MKNTMQKIAFLDRDGTLIYEPQDDYQIDSLDKLQILDGVIESLQKLIRAGFSLVMISNQDGLGTSSFSQENFDLVQNKLIEIFKKNKIIFDEVFICTHFESDNCSCRKPKTGLVDKFLSEIEIDRKNSFVCGDRKSDEIFAKNIGIKFIKTDTNNLLNINLTNL